MNRYDFQELARLRLQEAQVLLQHGCAEGAYYLAGYVVECALKACIARLTKEYDFPPDGQKIKEIYTHDLKKLLKSAGLEMENERQMKADKNFAVNWKLVEAWSEKKRYEKGTSLREAEEIIQALIDENGGILKWLKKHW